MPEEATSEPTACVSTLCKFYCEAVGPTNPLLPQGQKTVRLRAFYDDTLPEDRRFNRATPWGTMEFGLDNPALDGFFVTGQSYLIEVRPA